MEAFTYACSFGKRSWLVQAAILYEAQQRSTYGERTLETVARRFEIGLRQAQKYALVWKDFFAQGSQEENVNIDAILLDEPSWNVVAATETKEPDKWLAYAQDRKPEDPRYSLASFRRDIQLANLTHPVPDAFEGGGQPLPVVNSPCWKIGPALGKSSFAPHSGKPIPAQGCRECEFDDYYFLRNEAKV